MRKTLYAAIALLFVAASRGSAHHAFAAEYDEKKLVVVSGTVTEFDWTNPHAWVYVDGKDPAGADGKWGFEMGAPGGLLRRGWKQNELKKGDHITIEGFAAKDGRNVANARMVTLPSGRRLFGGFASTPGNPYK